MEALVASGQRPRASGRGLSLFLGRLRLRGPDGRLTAHGRRYEELAGSLQPAPTREGNVEYITSHAGARREVRRWDPAGMRWRYTRLGRLYFSTRRSEYQALMPILKRGLRKDGSRYEVPGFMPLAALTKEEQITLPQGLSAREADEEIKRMAMERLSPEQASGAEPLNEEYEAWHLDVGAPWRIEEMRTTPQGGNERAPRTVVLNRRLGTLRSVPLGLPRPDLLLPEALEVHEDRLCVARQLAAHGGEPLEEVLAELDHQLGAWRDVGVTPGQILEWARRRGQGCLILHGGTLESLEPLAPAPLEPVCLAVWEDHGFVYRPGEAAVRALRRAAEPRTEALARPPRRRKSDGPTVAEWVETDGSSLEGGRSYWSSNMDLVRRRMLAQGLVPKVVLRDAWEPRTLTAQRASERPIVVHWLPDSWRAIHRWYEALGLVYRGEGLPAATHRALLTLVREDRSREALSGEARAELLERHDFRCARCGAAFVQGGVEWDHCIPFNQLGAQSYQPLCLSCHREKTRLEPLALESDVLTSHFNPTAYQAYVRSPRMPPLVYRRAECDRIASCLTADVIRCRRRALEFTSHALPVACPLDDVEVVRDQRLGDLNLVTREAVDPISQLGYTGPGWQHRILTEFLLEQGVLEWGDISHRLTATGRLPCDLLRRPLQRMSACWGESDGDLAKRSVNALVGLFSLDDQWSYRHTSSHREDDAPRGGEVSWRRFPYPGGEVYDWVQRTRLTSSSSHRPLHDLCLSTEARRVGEMLVTLRRQRAVVYELKVDSVLYRPHARAAQTLQTLRLRDLGGSASEEPAFRVARALHGDRLGFAPGRPSREAWPPPPEPPGWEDLTAAEAEARLMEGGGSLLVLGIAGTGKSHFCRALVARLRALGLKVDCVAKTHVASQRIHGTTLDSYARRHILNGACTCDLLWIDEIGQVDVALLAQVNKLLGGGKRILLSGDFHQFGAICDSWRGCPLQTSLAESRLLRHLAGGNRTTLTTCRRSDARLFAFYSSLLPGGSRADLPLERCVAEARESFRHEGDARYNLVISHRHRVELNARLNRARRPADALFVPVKRERWHAVEAQNLWLWPGLELVSCGTNPPFKNGMVYVLEEVHPEWVRIGGAQVSMERVHRYLRLNYSMTYASVQGTEFTESLRLWDTSTPHFTRTHLYVGLSRARGAVSVGG